jgi:hypothetical protein
LERTIESLFRQLDAEPELRATVTIANNGTDPATRDVIFRYADRFESVVTFQNNVGISQAYERAIPREIPAKFVMFSEDDVEYRMPFSQYMRCLSANPQIGTVSGFHGPEHATVDRLSFEGRNWFVKQVLSSVHLVMTAAMYGSFRPIALRDKINFDWYLFTNSPLSLCNRGLKAAVLPGGALHLGGKESTWGAANRNEPPEAEIQQLVAESLISS